MAQQVDVDKLIDYGGKTLAGAAGFFATDQLLFEAWQPLVGRLLSVCCFGKVLRLVTQ